MHELMGELTRGMGAVWLLIALLLLVLCAGGLGCCDRLVHRPVGHGARAT